MHRRQKQEINLDKKWNHALTNLDSLYIKVKHQIDLAHLSNTSYQHQDD